VTLVDWATTLCLLAGSFFFLAGTLGVVRFPDVLARLHAVTKADNLGLGLVVLGLALQSDGILPATKLLLVWVLALVASATSCFLVANAVVRRGGRTGAGE
jgi:multicomponent Na+:H+ antiporter subunit G